MNARDFLVLAQTLASSATEAAWRSATSRAYYAAFHVASDMVEGLGFTVPSSEKAHAYLWMRLTNCGDSSTERAGWDLVDLRRERGFADYQLRRPFTQTLAQHTVQLGEEIIGALDAADVTSPMPWFHRDTVPRRNRDVQRILQPHGNRNRN